jgi:hypothetical protein
MRASAIRVLGAVVVTVLAIGLEDANAAFIQYGNRATFDALGPSVAVDWGAFGADGQLISTPDSRTISGLTVGIGSSQGALQRYDEGSSYTGNFAVGDHLLGDAGSESDSFIIRFGSPVKGFGTQIEAHYITGAYTGGIDVFSAGNVLLYSALFGGTRTSAEDNTAPFVGVMSDLANISYATFWIDQDSDFPAKSGPLLIDRLDVISQVPEPSALAVLSTALMGLFGFRLARKPRNPPARRA